MYKLPTRATVVFATLGALTYVAATLIPTRLSPMAVVRADDCQPVNDTCTQNDTTKTSVLTVNHVDTNTAGSPGVEPNTGEDWDIRAEWRTASGGGACSNAFETASCRVTWNGSGWSLSSVSLTTNIVAINVCSIATCSGAGGTHGWIYKLYVDITDPVIGAPNRNLYQVRYQTTSVDGGHRIASIVSSSCTGLGSAVSPTTQTFTAFDTPGDWGDERCAYQCSTGGSTPSTTLTYQ